MAVHAGAEHPFGKCDSWATRTRYVAENPDAVDRLFRERDAEFDWKGVYFLVLFDALDRCADDWKQMYRAIRGLLQAALDLRSYRRLRAKIFLRSDQADQTLARGFSSRKHAERALFPEGVVTGPEHAVAFRSGRRTLFAAT